jgi:CRP-like cAMP-binding protein
MTDPQTLQNAIDALVAMIAAVRNIRLYPPGSAMVTGSVERVDPKLRAILETQASVTFAESEKCLLISGEGLPEKDQKKPQISAFCDLMLDFGIKSIGFEKGFDPKDLAELLTRLSRKPEEYDGQGGLHGVMEAHPLPHIQIDHKVYVAMDQDREIQAPGGPGLSEADIITYLKGNNPDAAVDAGQIRKLAADPAWVSSVFRAGLKQTAAAGEKERGFGHMVTQLNSAAREKDRQEIITRAADSLADMDGKAIGTVLTQNPGSLLDTGLIEALAARMGPDKFAELAAKIKHAAGLSGASKGTGDLLDRLMKTDQGMAAGDRINTLFQQEQDLRHKQMKRFKAAMEQILRGRTDALADSEVMETLPVTVNQLIAKGKAQTAEAIIKRLLDNLRVSQDRQERTLILEALTRIGAPTLPAVISEMTPNAPWYYLRNLILLVGRLGSETQVPLLTPMLDTADFRIQREALNGVYQIGGDSRGDILLQSLEKVQSATKILVVSMLGILKFEPAVPALVRLLEESRQIAKAPIRDRLQERICAALGKIGDPGALAVLKRFAAPVEGAEPPVSGRVVDIAKKAVRIVGHRSTEPDTAPVAPTPRESTMTGTETQPETPPAGKDGGMEEAIDALLQKGDTDGAVKLVFDAIVAAARSKKFKQAEALRDRLFEIDDMALGEIVKAGEIIEEEKSDALDKDHLDMWPELYDKLTDEESNTLFFALTEQTFEPDEFLLEQGKPNDRLFFINQGQVKAIFSKDQRETLVQTIEKGEIVGNRTFFTISVCTISMIALSRVRASVLERSVLKEWKAHQPGLETKLKDYCQGLEKTAQLLKEKGVDRRVQLRVGIQGKVRIQLLNASHTPVGKAFRGDLADLSAGGISFFIRTSKEETARLLLGRNVNLAFRLPETGDTRPLEQHGTVIGVHYQLQNEYSIHVKFGREIDDAIIGAIAESPS